MLFNELYIFGAGGSGRELAWLAQKRFGRNVKLTFVVDKSDYLTPPVNGVEVKLFSELVPSELARFVVALGNPDDRQRIVSMFLDAGHQAVNLIHPRVEMSPLVHIGAGTVICANSVLTCNIAVGKHVQINIGCTINHDVTIGDFSTLSPAVNVAGNVRIGRRVFVGTNACFINGSADTPLVVGDDAVIAAGACVTHSVEANALVAGVPAVRKK
ncbi:MAG: acetyltransferase [Burkholderiales bacterium]|nr:acetyltransferase [Burkholderiales bacterium]